MSTLSKKITLFLCCILLLHISIYAQNEIDALRFSETDWQGSARFMGAGRAFGAVGAEFSALNVNPAAIGLYKKSEVTFTPLTISVYKNNSDYNNTNTLAQAVKTNIGSAGIVLAIPGVSSTLWKKIQLGFGFNRINNFNSIFSIEGRNAGSTIGSVFALEANGNNYENVSKWESNEAWFAWKSYLIDPNQGSQTEYTPALQGIDMFQSTSVTRKGGIDEMIFSIGTNYDDKLFLGATIGVPFINFTENRTYREVNDNKSDDFEFQKLAISDKLNVRSSGINLKLGAIYQPLDFLRVGVAFHTPTYYGNVKDYSERQMVSLVIDDEEIRNIDVSYANSSNYSLTTPLRAMANVAFLISQRAFISAEYEFADYSMATMYSGSYNFSEENKTVQNMYGFSHIARIGAEFNLNQIFALRAGYNYISSPYKDDINDASKHYASLGFGFRTKYFYGDFAYALITSKEKYWMFERPFVNETTNHFLTHRIMLTLGVRF